MPVNQVTLEARLGRAPELRFTQGGKAVCSASVVVDFSYFDEKTKKWEKDDSKAQWFNITAWEKRAELLALMPAGQLLHIEGRLSSRSWEGDDGKKNYKTEIVIDRFSVPVISERGMSVEGTDISFFRPGKKEQPVNNGFEDAASTNKYDYDEEPF